MADQCPCRHRRAARRAAFAAHRGRPACRTGPGPGGAAAEPVARGAGDGLHRLRTATRPAPGAADPQPRPAPHAGARRHPGGHAAYRGL
ncbi:hypothetical protein G6F50_017652 [Rhizopus delemar]|uniref:Uncharacterized protein n=1 Tax=Rhizopus delemar TaxID=936053 RepID=A0A9P6XPU6_9FUNG|nr:hypothetical protein G6F50_017652 [Rhizopus delemar]